MAAGRGSMSAYYHCAPIPLAIGSIIEPGNWGRVLRLYETQDGGLSITAINEALLEQSRKVLAPAKPSRLECVFTLPTLEIARAYRQAHCKTNLIYRVDPVDTDATFHEGDYALAIRPLRGLYFDQMFQRCASYWTDPPTSETLEILVSCPVKVVGREA